MSEPLSGKTIVLGITGSIAAYKGAEVARRLMDLGANVHATLTRAGAQFITPLTMRTLTHNPVTLDMFDEPEEWDVKHVSLAQRADAVVVAPASANALVKLSLGLADEFIYTVALATRAPLLVAPAMNDKMLAHPAVQEHLARLRERGVEVVEPESGRLASGAVGWGRLPAPEAIAEAVVRLLGGADLDGVSILVTAGPTREPLDPVRFISNRSSGKMGYALGERAAARGARVVLVSGPAALPDPPGCEVVRVETAQQMRDEVVVRFPECRALIAAAAVADYAPVSQAPAKLKKGRETFSLELTITPDVLAECGRSKRADQTLVGFAAETDDAVENARRKLTEKNLNLMVANDVSRPGIGFDSDQNAGHLLFADGRRVELPAMAKKEFADRILDELATALKAAGG